MLGYLTLILVCQLAGELITGSLGLPVPGPVLEMVLLFLFLLIRGTVPAELDQTASGLLKAMSSLFVPAGTGVVLHLQLLSEALVPLAASLVVSTLAAIAVTALLMRWLDRGTDRG